VDRCAECGFEYELTAAASAGPAILTGVAELSGMLSSGRADLRIRSQPTTWSPLEYGCHVRDVLLVQRERVLAARRTDCPSFDPIGRDERVEHDGYAGQDPDRVARQLTEAAYLFANVLARLVPEDWDRTVMYNYPDRFERTLRWVALHTVHEVHHHLLDVNRALSRPSRAET
jgi:DinB superfamily